MFSRYQNQFTIQIHPKNSRRPTVPPPCCRLTPHQNPRIPFPSPAHNKGDLPHLGSVREIDQSKQDQGVSLFKHTKKSELVASIRCPSLLFCVIVPCVPKKALASRSRRLHVSNETGTSRWSSKASRSSCSDEHVGRHQPVGSVDIQCQTRHGTAIYMPTLTPKTTTPGRFGRPF